MNIFLDNCNTTLTGHDFANAEGDEKNHHKKEKEITMSKCTVLYVCSAYATVRLYQPVLLYSSASTKKKGGQRTTDELCCSVGKATSNKAQAIYVLSLCWWLVFWMKKIRNEEGCGTLSQASDYHLKHESRVKWFERLYY